MSNLEKKNIIVTGASGGIGNAIIEKLSESGANILASGTRIEKLEELKKNFKNINPDYLVLLGDRYEILSAAKVAANLVDTKKN